MSSACTHTHGCAPAEDGVRAALGRGEVRTTDAGQRWTEPRRRVYELLLRAGAPVKAYDLMERYAEHRTAKPPTVYRALEHLEQVGLVHRIPSLNAYVACDATEDEAAHAPAFLICDCCGSAQEFEPGHVPAARAAAKAAGFAPRTVAVEVRGRCDRCA